MKKSLSNNNNESKHLKPKPKRLDEVLEEIRKNDNFIASRSHNMLVYDELESFEKFYARYAAKWLPRSEIVLIATQYQTFDKVDRALRKTGMDITKYMDEGSLLIIDAQHGYMLGDVNATKKLAMTLVQRARQEGRHGVSWIGDMGSFIGFQRVTDLMDYELSCPQQYEDEMIRTVCCYHEGDFRRLSSKDRNVLHNHHFSSVTIG